jgi:hypothetical protein
LKKIKGTLSYSLWALCSLWLIKIDNYPKTWQAGTKRNDRMKLPTDSDDSGERPVLRQVEAVTALPCY